ncbi:hypothetical protein SOV_33960 [Sporomusa ovata DSM 2662]|uniref:Uncharacterized protein n=1 Tax=Sporomusa ovata TaxID=2378 RepID=A0A0U1L2I4_9FIRM|nr:hypothetical protein [Sporomusa ovata]EQB25331.1 hypothetical protein SOV_5c04990 [Sporomusa ovata DSM 2662]CQR73897.1 hypothetical protein SpAn4DRAFT_0359 [Sporomusa ovata]
MDIMEQAINKLDMELEKSPDDRGYLCAINQLVRMLLLEDESYADKVLEETHTLERAYKTMQYIAKKNRGTATWFAQYPQLKYLSKCGLSEFVKAYLERYPVTRGLLNWRGKSLQKVLGFQPTKQELCHIGKAKLSGVRIASWITLRKSGCPVHLPDLDTYGWFEETSVLSELREVVPLDKLFAYQKRLEKRGELTAYFFRDYWDYLRECKQLNFDMSRKETLYPNKLAEKHLQNQLRIKQKRSRLLDEKFTVVLE